MFTVGQKLCCIITGASRGFGVALSKAVARQSCEAGNSVCFILTARSLPGLEKTAAAIQDIYSSAKVHCVSADLQDTDSLSLSVKTILGKVDASSFTHVLLINNAGSIGDPSKKIKQFDDYCEIQNHLNLNVTAEFYLAFVSTFESVPNKYIVNISTLCATLEVMGLSLYCMSKAATDMMFKVLAKEEPNFRVLNYAPGPLETDMHAEVKKNVVDPSFKDLKALNPEDSSAKLMKLLKKDEFKSGSHIDYYDIE